MGEKTYLPDCWKDDLRMGALFSAVRSREVNPKDLETKVSFWSNLISEWACSGSGLAKFNLTTLRQTFSRKGREPLCLNDVLQDMLRTGHLMRMSDFVSYTTNQSWLGWTLNILVARPIKLGWSWTLGSYLQTTTLPPDEEFVYVQLIQSKAKEVMEIHQSEVENATTDNIVTFDTLWQRCCHLLRSQSELDLVLMYLQRERLAVVGVEDGIKVIKFSSESGRGSTEIKEADLCIVRLKKAHSQISQQVEQHQADITRLDKDVREMLQKGLKTQAKCYLRKKKTLEKVLEKKMATADNLETLLSNLAEAESDKLIVDAYKAGVMAFKSNMAENGLTPEAVDETMLDIQEVLDTQKDIESAMAQGSVSFSTDLDMNQEELEAELANLVQEDEIRQERTRVGKRLRDGTLSPKQVLADSHLLDELLSMDVPENEPSPPKQRVAMKSS